MQGRHIFGVKSTSPPSLEIAKISVAYGHCISVIYFLYPLISMYVVAWAKMLTLTRFFFVFKLGAQISSGVKLGSQRGKGSTLCPCNLFYESMNEGSWLLRGHKSSPLGNG